MTLWKSPRRDLNTLEFSVATVLLIAFVWVTVHELSQLEAAAERASFNATVNRMKSAVMLQALTYLVRDDRAALAALEELNPMELMANAPFNYAGPIDGAAGLKPRAWYYDRAVRQLVYVFHHPPTVAVRGEADGCSRFRVRIRYVDRDQDGEFLPGVDDFTGVTLELVSPPGSVAAPARAG